MKPRNSVDRKLYAPETLYNYEIHRKSKETQEILRISVCSLVWKTTSKCKEMQLIIPLPPAQATPSNAQEKMRLSASRYKIRLSQNCKGAPLRPELRPLP